MTPQLEIRHVIEILLTFVLFVAVYTVACPRGR